MASIQVKWGMWTSLLLASSVQAQSLYWDLRHVPLSSFIETATLQDLVDTVVTDTKTAQPANTVTQKIEVLYADEFDLLPGTKRNLAELVTPNSGQFVNVLFRTNGNWGSFGGLGPKYNTYLLDGVPMDNFLEAMTLDPMAISSVELYKGPASVLYANYLSMDFAGNQAPVAGTTNFMLKKEVDHPLTRVQAGTGTWGTHNGQLYHQGREGALSYIASAFVERSDYTGRYNTNPDGATTESPNYLRQQAFGSLNYQFAEAGHAVSVFGQLSAMRGDEGRPNRDFDHDYGVLNASYSRPLAPNLALALKAGWRRADRGFDNDLYPTSLALDRFERTRQTVVPLEASLQLTQGPHLVTTGVDHQRADYDVSNRLADGTVSRTNTAQARSSGVYLQDKLQWDAWVLRAGLRYNDLTHDYDVLGGNVPEVNHKRWDKLLWSLGARRNVSPELAWYTNAGSSFMPPSAKQIGGTVPATSPTAAGELANPGLRPESGLGLDAGMDWAPARDFKLGVRVFRTRLANAIVTSALSANQSRSLNEAQVVSQGAEFDVRYERAERYAAFFNVTGINSRLNDPAHPETDGAAMPFSPDWLTNLGVYTRVGPQARLSAWLRWVGRYYDGSDRTQRTTLGHNTQLNVRADWLWRPNVQLYLDLINATNSHDAKPFGMADTGRQAFVGAVYGF